jgi:hypothetical protein
VHRCVRRSYRNVMVQEGEPLPRRAARTDACAQKRAGRTAVFGAKLAQFVADARVASSKAVELSEDEAVERMTGQRLDAAGVQRRRSRAQHRFGVVILIALLLYGRQRSEFQV